jgi:hypothetical protein
MKNCFCQNTKEQSSVFDAGSVPESGGGKEPAEKRMRICMESSHSQTKPVPGF